MKPQLRSARPRLVLATIQLGAILVAGAVIAERDIACYRSLSAQRAGLHAISAAIVPIQAASAPRLSASRDPALGDGAPVRPEALMRAIDQARRGARDSDPASNDDPLTRALTQIVVERIPELLALLATRADTVPSATADAALAWTLGSDTEAAIARSTAGSQDRKPSPAPGETMAALRALMLAAASGGVARTVDADASAGHQAMVSAAVTLWNAAAKDLEGLLRSQQHDVLVRGLGRVSVPALLLVLVLAVRNRFERGRDKRSRSGRARDPLPHDSGAAHAAVGMLYDRLTGLPNSRFCVERLRGSLRWAKNAGRCVTVAILDLDNFAMVNRSFGSEIGDELIRSVGRRLHEGIRDCDIVARMDGDTFVVVLTRLAALAEAAPIMEQRVLPAVLQAHPLEDGEFRVNCSVGLAAYPEHGEDAEVLMHRAELALRAAKQVGRGALRWYFPELEIATGHVVSEQAQAGH